MPRGRAYIGTSGWSYDSWGETFYGGRPKRDWLRFCAERFSAIEANATFYRLQSKATFQRWRRETPLEFRFAIKANRYLTHNKKLGDPLPPIERDLASGLGAKLVAVVWQLPANFHRNLERLEGFARALGTGGACATRSSSATPRGSTSRSPRASPGTGSRSASPTVPTGPVGGGDHGPRVRAPARP